LSENQQISKDRFIKDRDYRVEMVRQFPMLFIKTYLSHRLMKRLDNGHKVPCGSADFHYDLCDNALKKRVIAMWARGFGKSFINQEALVLWRICTDPDGGGGREILELTCPQVVRRPIKNVAAELQFNKLIVSDFGRLVTDKCTVKTENEPEVTTTNGWIVRSRSVNSGVRGLRPDIVLCDDFINPSEAKNPDLRAKARDFFYEDVEGMMLPNTQKVMLGTPMHPEDIICSEFESDKWDAKLFVPAEYEDKQGIRHSNWPEMWPLNALDKKRIEMEAGRVGSYQQEYMLVPFLAANQLWTPEMIQFWEKPAVYHEVLPVTAVDLASGVREENSQTAIITVGGLTDDRDWGRQGDIFQLKEDVGHFSPSEVVRRVLHHCEMFDFNNRLIVENKAWHLVFEEMFKKELKQLGYSMPKFDFVKAMPGEDKKTRAESVVQFYKDRRVYHIPDSVAAKQMMLFTGRRNEKNDAVDAMVYALRWFLGRKWYGINKNRGIVRTVTLENLGVRSGYAG